MERIKVELESTLGLNWVSCLCGWYYCGSFNRWGGGGISSSLGGVGIFSIFGYLDGREACRVEGMNWAFELQSVGCRLGMRYMGDLYSVGGFRLSGYLFRWKERGGWR